MFERVARECEGVKAVNWEQMESGENNCDGKDDDDVSVIAVIEKEHDRSSRHQQTVKPDEKQEDRRVIELSVGRSEMALRKQQGLESLSTDEILHKLSPGMVDVNQDKRYKDDSDYVRDSTETSSGGSTSGGGVAKVRRAHRAVRKARGVAEVRRNPLRGKKKDPDKNFPRLRQRLISAKRKEMLFDPESSKRGKSSTKPYMNTRSVTRKMYNVGATYQAPTIRDALEWKEWPVHGMHERPVFHPQLGLAAEYLGRYFTSFDGLSYCEIVDRPEVEVVSVDPHCDFVPSSSETKRIKRAKSNKTVPASAHSSKDPSKKKKTFESCMHESFHCVLGYCSQVMTPTYKNNVEGKLDMLNENKNPSTVVREAPKQLVMAKPVDQSPKIEASNNSMERVQQPVEETRALDSYTAVMMPQNVKSFSQIPKTRLLPAQKVYLTNSQKSIALANVKTLQGGQMKIQEMIRPSKNPFILVNTSDIKDAQFLKPATSNANTKQEDTPATEESLGEVSSIYKHFDLSEELASKQTPPKREKKVEFAMTRYLLNTAKQTKIKVPNDDRKLYYKIPNKETNVRSPSGGQTKTCCANEASEIAKILSDYNKNNTKRPTSENIPFCTVKNIRVGELCNKDENAAQNSQDNSNVNITFPQGKWRRFHLTVEKLKDMKNSASEQRLLSGIQNRQSFFRINPTVLDATPGRMIEVSKHLEMLQREQTNAAKLEKKKSTQTTNQEANTTGPKTQYLQELLEDTAMLYCAATGTHQDDLASYIDTLDAVQSVQWLDGCKNA